MSGSAARVEVTNVTHDGRVLALLTALPGFDFADSEAPRGRYLAALEELILPYKYRSLDRISPVDVAQGVSHLESGPWCEESGKQHLPNISGDTIKAAIEFYVTGYKKALPASETSRISYPISDLQYHVAGACLSVEEWLDLED
ncbi:hypothetical protein F5Y05DRAFT_424881 [Hypoxylon sp. FL0543]|nr:hypothetical protein F5Y05DRAFT_424881 [Hypoxylon sp. FL0543]